MRVVNTLFHTKPIVIHANGHHQHKPHWEMIKEVFFNSDPLKIGNIDRLTILTCNNGHASMGILEQSLAHLGIPCKITGTQVSHWINSIHKPQTILEALGEIETEYTLYVDSRDAIVIDNPQFVVDCFERDFDCELVFGGDRLNWPPLSIFKKFEQSIARSEFAYLNGGIWIGKTSFCGEFFAKVVETPPVAQAVDSEQGILKKLFPEFYPRIQLDYHCQMFQNMGFVVAPILEIVT